VLWLATFAQGASAPATGFRDVLKSAEIDSRLAAIQEDQPLIERTNYDIRLRVCASGPCKATTPDKPADTILHIRKGAALITINGRRHEVSAGDIVHLPRVVKHEITPRGGRLEYVAVSIFPEGDTLPPRRGLLAQRTMPDVLKKAEIDAVIAGNDRNQPIHASNGYTMNYVIYPGRPGPWEAHRGCVDVYFIQRGKARALLGGEITNPQEETPGEIRGDGVKGAREYEIGPGDMVLIPRLGEHHMIPQGDKLAYVLLKIWAD
jgi:mannose-6-phosphate isomerase-like protein (cupin superfamily)